MAARPPIRLPSRYAVRSHIASGGMASVWEADDRLLGRTVAVKVLAPHFAEDADARERFAREARMAASVSSHAHIVTVYDVGEHDGDSFLVMEHFSGGTVAQRIRRLRDNGTHIDREIVLRWLRDAAGGLEVAHAAGIVHRDVKPANLLIDGSGRVAVGDFGIARVLDEAAFTATGQVLGTAAYLSPEQAAGHPATAASDCYALAVVAFELLTGRRPFPDGPFAAQALAHAQQEPPRPSSIEPSLPLAVDDALVRGLAKDPARRPASVTALVSELADACEGRTSRSPHPADPPTNVLQPPEPETQRDHETAATRRLQPAPPRHPATPRPAPPQPTPPRQAPPKGSGRGAIITVLALLALAAGGAAAVVLAAASNDEDRPRAQTTPSTSAGGGEEPSRTTRTPPSTSSVTTDPPPSADPAASPEDLNDQGFALIGQGAFGEAVAPLQESVRLFREQGRTDELVYGFALFNLGQSLNRSGQPAAAIPLLEERLKFPNQRGVVERELEAARAAAAGTAPEAAEPGNGNGNGNNNGKKDKDEDDDDG